MRCEVCGLPLFSNDWRGVRSLVVQRMRSLSSSPSAALLTEPVAFERATVCSEACADRQRQRWQNQDLAKDIAEGLGLKAQPAGRMIAMVIAEHRARWEDS